LGQRNEISWGADLLNPVFILQSPLEQAIGEEYSSGGVFVAFNEGRIGEEKAFNLGKMGTNPTMVGGGL
jgi:hypothetical protein